MSTAPYGPIDPNSQHQRWSRWIFIVKADRKIPTEREARENFFRWCATGFQSTVGRGRCERRASWGGIYYRFVIEIEGPPAHDPEYVESVKAQFQKHFMAKGFGQGAQLHRFRVILLAGDTQDGKPPEQMIVLPTINLRDLLAPGGA